MRDNETAPFPTSTQSKARPSDAGSALPGPGSQRTARRVRVLGPKAIRTPEAITVEGRSNTSQHLPRKPIRLAKQASPTVSWLSCSASQRPRSTNGSSSTLSFRTHWPAKPQPTIALNAVCTSGLFARKLRIRLFKKQFIFVYLLQDAPAMEAAHDGSEAKCSALRASQH
jgi:hypothetical protein